MARVTLVPPVLNWANRNRTSSTPGQTAPVGTTGSYITDTSLDNRLTAISATTFTPARLEQMTQNDKIFAVRTLDDPTTI